MSNPNRTFAFLTQHNVSVAMETAPAGDDKTLVTLAMAFCRDSGRRRDQFNRTVAESILTKRLASPAADDRGLRQQFVYHGKKPRVDVFYPILDAIRRSAEEKVEITLTDLTDYLTKIVIVGTIIEKTSETITLRTENGNVTVNRNQIKNMDTIRTRRNVEDLQEILKLQRAIASGPSETVVSSTDDASW